MPITTLSPELNNFFWVLVNESHNSAAGAPKLSDAHATWHTSSRDQLVEWCGYGKSELEETEDELHGLVNTYGEEYLLEDLTYLP